jgi:hypothetical protein
MRTRRKANYPPLLDEVYAMARDDAGDDVRGLAGPLPDLWSDWMLRCLYELDSPEIENRSATLDDGSEVVWLLGADGSWARAEGVSQLVHQSGPRRLWDDLERVQQTWSSSGQFSLDQLNVELSPDQSTLTSPDGRWTFTL